MLTLKKRPLWLRLLLAPYQFCIILHILRTPRTYHGLVPKKYALPPWRASLTEAWLLTTLTLRKK